MNDKYIGALWQKEMKKGGVYFSGKVKIGEEEIQIVVFPNKKQNENQPDWNILKSKPYKPETKREEEEIDVEDIPF